MEYDRGLLGGSTVLMLLSLLHENDMYGYEIIKELETRSNDAFKFKEGTLYPVLHRMENMNYVKSYKKEAENGKERKYYAITAEGIRQLNEEQVKWKSFELAVNMVIGGRAYAAEGI